MTEVDCLAVSGVNSARKELEKSNNGKRLTTCVRLDALAEWKIVPSCGANPDALSDGRCQYGAPCVCQGLGTTTPRCLAGNRVPFQHSTPASMFYLYDAFNLDVAGARVALPPGYVLDEGMIVQDGDPHSIVRWEDPVSFERSFRSLASASCLPHQVVMWQNNLQFGWQYMGTIEQDMAQSAVRDLPRPIVPLQLHIYRDMKPHEFSGLKSAVEALE